MTCKKELQELATWAESRGAVVIINEKMENDGALYIDSLQVIGLKGCGPCPMSPIYAAETLRRLRYEVQP